MSEFPHDSFAKNYLTELLNTIGTGNQNRAILELVTQPTPPVLYANIEEI
jgi:hypothetical protein